MKYLFFILVLCLSSSILADEVSVEFNKEDLGSSYRYVKGISGDALDLSADAINRKGLVLPAVDDKMLDGSFSFFVWVKSTARYLGVKALVTNKKTESEIDNGILLATQDNGSWMLLLSKGKGTQYEYRPTVERQPVNDSRWHQLGVSFNASRQEIRMYYDGNNVAIYHVRGVNCLKSGLPFRLACIDESEWKTFNGYLDHFLFRNEVMPDNFFSDDYIAKVSGKHTPKLAHKLSKLSIMGFNIYHGGHELGEEIGVERVIDVIRDSGADVVGLIETYGSGEKIADALGYYFYLRSSNLAIMSRYPIEETYDLFRPFNCGGVSIRVSRSQTIHYVNLWLDYLPGTNQQIKDRLPVAEIIAEEWKTRASEMKRIIHEMSPLMNKEKVPLFVSGDFNIDSHLDWTEAARHLHEGYVVEWPVSKLMEEAGFIDSYRDLYPDPVKNPCKTWSPMWKDELQYRIDFIYYRKGQGVQPKSSRMIDYHKVRFPSDHAAMLTTFNFSEN